MIRASVYYPSGEGEFDMDYYLNSHIPLVERLMAPYGLLKVEVDQGIGGGRPGEPAPFVAVAQMVFNSMEELQNASEAHDSDLAADVKNFTEIEPFFQVSEIVK